MTPITATASPRPIVASPLTDRHNAGLVPEPRIAVVGERVARARRRRGLSQEVCAGLVGRTEGWLRKIEKGQRNLDRLPLIKALAVALNVSVSELTDSYELGRMAEGERAVVAAELQTVRKLLATGRTEIARGRLDKLAAHLTAAQ